MKTKSKANEAMPSEGEGPVLGGGACSTSRADGNPAPNAGGGPKPRSASSADRKWTKRGAAERREHIAQTAAKLLLEGGGERLTHRKVAAAAGVPLGSTTQYFKSIDELRRAGLQCVAKSLLEETSQMSRQIRESGGDLDILADEYCSYLCDPDCIKEELALYRGALNDPEVRDLFEQFEWRFVDEISGAASPGVARLLSTLWDGVVINTYLTGEPFDKELLTRAMEVLASMEVGDSEGERLKAPVDKPARVIQEEVTDD